MLDKPMKTSSILEEIESLWFELRRLSHDHLRIAALETQRVGETLVELIIAGVMVALLLSATWLGLLAFAVIKLIENGIMASTAILLAVIFNLILALFICGMIRRKSNFLQFPATIRSLKPIPTKEHNDEKP
jgi:ABC-type uncharacterized transport system permease subunit